MQSLSGHVGSVHESEHRRRPMRADDGPEDCEPIARLDQEPRCRSPDVDPATVPRRHANQRFREPARDAVTRIVHGTTFGFGSIRITHSPFWLSFTHASPFL